MAQGSMAEGLTLLDRLDEALACILQPPEDVAFQHEQLKDLENAAAHFAHVAGQVERLLLQLRKSVLPSVEEELKQEIQALEAVLDRKEALIKHCEGKINSWKQTCIGLRELHQKNVFTSQ